jgi:hypothetical protein
LSSSWVKEVGTAASRALDRFDGDEILKDGQKYVSLRAESVSKLVKEMKKMVELRRWFGVEGKVGWD